MKHLNTFIMKERVEEYIKARGLDKKDRRRNKHYERIILTAILRDQGVSYTAIGVMMNRNHATIINMMKNYEWLITYSDFRDMEAMIKKELNHYSIEERVLKLDNIAELHELQEELKKRFKK